MALTDEDKKWITAQLEAFGSQFKVLLESTESRAEAFGVRLEVRVEARLEATENRLENRLEARLEATETKLLRAFHDWASPVEMRARSHAAAIRALDIEVESLGNRVAKIEPPQ